MAGCSVQGFFNLTLFLPSVQPNRHFPLGATDSLKCVSGACALSRQILGSLAPQGQPSEFIPDRSNLRSYSFMNVAEDFSQKNIATKFRQVISQAKDLSMPLHHIWT